VGGALVWASWRWERAGLAWFNRQTLAAKIALCLAASLLLIAIGGAGYIFLPPADPAQWEVTAAAALPPQSGEPAINPRDLGGVVGVAGAFFGFMLGALLLFARDRFEARGQPWQLAARLLIGLAGVVVIWMGLRLVFPRDASLVSQVLRYLRYVLAGLWMGYGAPKVFIKLKL
jgi:hypothetical protein